jgi:hypothetical protein
MDYPGYCAKYGARKMFGLGFIFGTAAGIGVECIMNGAQYAFECARSGYAGGALGMVGASLVHPFADAYCSKRKMGITKGGALTKKMQIAVYSTVLTGAITLHQLGIYDPHEVESVDENEKTSLQLQIHSRSLENSLA